VQQAHASAAQAGSRQDTRAGFSVLVRCFSLVGPLFVEERDGDAFAALGTCVESAVEPDRRRGNLILGRTFKRHHQDMLVAVVMGKPCLDPDMQSFRPALRWSSRG